VISLFLRQSRRRFFFSVNAPLTPSLSSNRLEYKFRIEIREGKPRAGANQGMRASCEQSEGGRGGQRRCHRCQGYYSNDWYARQSIYDPPLPPPSPLPPAPPRRIAPFPRQDIENYPGTMAYTRSRIAIRSRLLLIYAHNTHYIGLLVCS